MMKAIYRWTQRYGIFHIIFWLWFWWIDTESISAHYGKNFSYISNACYSATTITFYMLEVYAITVFLKRIFLDKKRYALFSLTALCALFLFPFLSFHVQQWVYNIQVGKPVELRFLTIYLSNLIEGLIITLVFLAFKVLHQYFDQKQDLEQIKQQHIKAELEFLQRQINPHFLFNSINSVFVLIDVDKEEARKSLHQFSEMLRYQIYECKQEFISLNNELKFIDNYLKMEQLRKGNEVDIQFVHDAFPDDWQIVPFLLITFVENACKFVGSSSEAPSSISIKAERHQNAILFTCSNTVDPDKKIITEGGVGLANTKRRLELAYKNKSQLEITQKSNEFNALLRIELV